MFALFTKDIGVTTLIIRSHSDDAAYFTFIELTSSVVEIFIKALTMGHYSKASEKPLLTGITLHGCRTPKAWMFGLFNKDMEILCDNINHS